MPISSRLPLLAAAVGLLLAVAPALALDYRVTYRGVFSLGRDMPIADVSIVERAVTGGALRELQLEASSAPYPVVESLYPLRYRISSWVDREAGLVAFETYERTRKTRHRLYLRDQTPHGMKRLDRLAGEGDHEIERLRAGQVGARPQQQLFDRLGLLAQLRSRELVVGQRFSLPVTDGRDRMRYDIVVENVASVALGHNRVAAIKLRLDAWEPDERGGETPAHRPAYIWLSDDRQRRPLKIEVRHTIGLFRVELKGAGRDIAMLARESAAKSDARALQR